MLLIENDERVRILTLNRPEAKNAFNEALYDATAEAIEAAASDRSVGALVITGAGDAFSAGTDLLEMAARTAGGAFVAGRHGFPGMIDQLTAFPKPLILAINGIGLGIGATIVGFADLVFMSTTARLKCPFTTLAVAPEAASSALFPQLIGHQNAMWALLSADWLSAEECVRMGLAWKAVAPDDLMAVTRAHAHVLANKPLESILECKAVIVASRGAAIAAARERENGAFQRLLGQPDNVEALTAFAEKRPPRFHY